MNPRDMDAFYDAIKAYDLVRNGEANPDSTWRLKADINTYVPHSYTVKYTSSTGETIYEQIYPLRKPTKRRQEPELEAGDTTALDEFLGGFGNAKE